MNDPNDLSSNHHSSLHALTSGASRISLFGVALALGACDSGEELEPADQSPTAQDPGDEAFADEALAELRLGDQGPEIAAAHAYLRRFGYFPNPELAAQYPGWTPVIDVEPEDPDLFDLTLEEALASYQQGYGLPVTGRLDAATRALMQQPRCGHPDRHAAARLESSVTIADDGGSPSVDDPSAPGDELAVPVDPSEYQYFPNNLTYTDLRYGIETYSNKLDPGFQDAEVVAATQTWSAVAPVVFTRRTTRDISIRFVQHSHGDGKNFTPSIYSHDSPPTCDQNYGVFNCTAAIHFNNQSVTWGIGNNGPNVQDLQSHVLHQLGHALGLAHSADPNAVMYGSLPPGQVRRTLAPDDILGISTLYPTFRDLRIYEPQWYLDLNPKLATEIQNNPKTGSLHWILHGRKEWRSGSPAFDVVHYLAVNPAVAQFVGNNPETAFWHWRETGLKNGLTSSPAFDVKYYLNYWPDLKAEFIDSNKYGTALVHWLVHGINEGRRASALFDPAWYLQNNPSVSQIHGLTNYRAGLVHWLTVGRAQNLKGAP